MTFLSLRIAYKPHPDFKSINFVKAMQLIFQQIRYLSSNDDALNAWNLIYNFIFTLPSHKPLLSYVIIMAITVLSQKTQTTKHLFKKEERIKVNNTSPVPELEKSTPVI